MTLARRPSAVETSLTPMQLVLRWLAETHAHGSFEAYAAALLDAPAEDVPLSRLCWEAARAARAGSRSRLPAQTDQAIEKNLLETAFRFFLVLRINVTALRTAGRGADLPGARARQPGAPGRLYVR